MEEKEKFDRHTLSVNSVAFQSLLNIRAKLEREVGFKPSMSQVIEYLASKVEQDKLTGGQNV